jgi:hypothetical protein
MIITTVSFRLQEYSFRTTQSLNMDHHTRGSGKADLRKHQRH